MESVLQATHESVFEDGDEDKFNNFVTRLLRCQARITPLKVLNIYSNQSQVIEYWVKYHYNNV
jgi:hypothetical protein